MTVNKLVLSSLVWLAFLSEATAKGLSNEEVDLQATKFVSEIQTPFNIMRSREKLATNYPILFQWLNAVEGNLLKMDPSATLLLPPEKGLGALVITCSHCAYMPSDSQSKIGYPSSEMVSATDEKILNQSRYLNLSVDQLFKHGSDTADGPAFLVSMGAHLQNKSYQINRLYTPFALTQSEGNSGPLAKYSNLPVVKDFAIFLMDDSELQRLLANRRAKNLPAPHVTENANCKLKTGDWVMILGFPHECADAPASHMTIGKVEELPLENPEFARRNKEFISNETLKGAKFVRGAITCEGSSGGGVFNSSGEFCGILPRRNVVLPLSAMKAQLAQDISDNISPGFLERNLLMQWLLK